MFLASIFIINPIQKITRFIIIIIIVKQKSFAKITMSRYRGKVREQAEYVMQFTH